MQDNVFTKQEIESEQEIESFKSSLDKITDDNIDKTFQVFTKQEVLNMLLKDKVWFKMSDRWASIEELEEELLDDRNICREIIFGSANTESELEKLAIKKIDEIIQDYEINHAQ